MTAQLSDNGVRIRLVVLLVGCLLLVASVSGVLNAELFVRPSTTKYLVTVGGAAFVALLAMARAPLRLLVGLALIVAPFDDVVTFAGIQISALLVVDVLAILVWSSRARDPGSASLRPMAVIFVLLLIPAVAGSNNIGHELSWLIVTVATGCMTYLVAREPGGPVWVGAMLAISAVIQAALAIWEFHTGHQLSLYQASASVAVSDNYFFQVGRLFRPSGGLADPIGLGNVLALCVPMMIALAFTVRRRYLAVVILASAGLASLALLLSLSRASLLAVVAGAVVVLVLLPGRARVGALVVIAVVAIGVTVAGIGLGGSQLKQRVASTFSPTSSHVRTHLGDITREREWTASLKIAEANILTGVGFGNVVQSFPKYGVPANRVDNTQDIYLDFFAGGGILALLALVGIIGASFHDLARAFPVERVWVAGATGALIATVIAGVTDVELLYVQVSAMVAALVGVIAALGATASGVRRS